jgi:hypothetical protein
MVPPPLPSDPQPGPQLRRLHPLPVRGDAAPLLCRGTALDQDAMVQEIAPNEIGIGVEKRSRSSCWAYEPRRGKAGGHDAPHPADVSVREDVTAAAVMTVRQRPGLVVQVIDAVAVEGGERGRSAGHLLRPRRGREDHSHAGTVEHSLTLEVPRVDPGCAASRGIAGASSKAACRCGAHQSRARRSRRHAILSGPRLGGAPGT